MDILKKHIYLLFLISVVGHSQESVNLKNLPLKNETYYQANSTIPYSGSVYSLYDTGEILVKGFLVNGKWEWSDMYYKNGQKQFENHLRNGVRHGNQLWWYETGQLKSSKSYKHGVQDGPFKAWWPDGMIMADCVYADGVRKNFRLIEKEK